MKPKVTRAGMGLMLLQDNKVLLGLRHEDKEKADSDLNGEGTWTFPGGKYDFQDGLLEGAKRELKEETNLDLLEAEIISVSNERVETAHYVTLGWQVTKWSGEIEVMEPDEIVKWEWFDLGNLPKNLYAPTAKFIENVKQNRFVNPKDL